MSVISVPLTRSVFRLRRRDLESARPGRESFGGDSSSRMVASLRPRMKLRSSDWRGGQRQECRPRTHCSGVPCRLSARSAGVRVTIHASCRFANTVQSIMRFSGCRRTIAIRRLADSLYCEQSIVFHSAGSTDAVHHALHTSEHVTSVSGDRYLKICSKAV